MTLVGSAKSEAEPRVITALAELDQPDLVAGRRHAALSPAGISSAEVTVFPHAAAASTSAAQCSTGILSRSCQP